MFTKITEDVGYELVSQGLRLILTSDRETLRRLCGECHAAACMSDPEVAIEMEHILRNLMLAASRDIDRYIFDDF